MFDRFHLHALQQGSDSGFTLPKNVRIARFIPFNELFKHTDVLINNTGYGAVQQALYRGVPMVLAGLGEDKPDTSAKAAWAGVAINLACQRPEPKRIREAVETVLRKPKYRERAKQLSEEYSSYDMIGEIAKAVDEMAFARRMRAQRSYAQSQNLVPATSVVMAVLSS